MKNKILYLLAISLCLISCNNKNKQNIKSVNEPVENISSPDSIKENELVSDSFEIGKIVYLNDDRVRIRDNDTLTSNSLDLLTLGTVGVIEKIGNNDTLNSVSNKWIYIKVNESLSGWVWGEFLSPVTDEILEKCKQISLSSFEIEDYLYFKNFGITRYSEIVKLFTVDQIEKISKVHIDMSEPVDFENIYLFPYVDYIYISNTKEIDTSLMPKNISRIYLKNCEIKTLDLSCFSEFEGLNIISCKTIDKIIYPDSIDFVSFYYYPEWNKEIDCFPESLRELYLCYDNINHLDFLEKLLKYKSLECVYLEGNTIPEEEIIHGYGHFGVVYSDEY